jgi:hypothetical protein
MTIKPFFAEVSTGNWELNSWKRVVLSRSQAALGNGNWPQALLGQHPESNRESVIEG